MSTQASLGQAALDKKDYNEAIQQYTKALSTNTSNPSPLWLIQRSIAYQRSGNHELALIDADFAVHAALDRGRREFIATAHFRRAVALYGLKRYGDARLCLTWCRKANEKEKGLGIWQAKLASDFEKAKQTLGEDAKELKTTVKEIPEKIDFAKSEAFKVIEIDQKPATLPTENDAGANSNAKDKDKGKQEAKADEPSLKNDGASKVLSPPSLDDPQREPHIAPGRTPLDKVRNDWYQSTDKITITLLVKGVPAHPITEVVIRKNFVGVYYPLTDADDNKLWIELKFEDLDGEVDTEGSTFTITKTKIEIILKKSVSGVKWKRVGSFIKGHIERSSDKITEIFDNENSRPSDKGKGKASQETGPAQPKGPAYPTSSRNGPKDWDKLASVADKDEDGEGDVNSFFKTLYSNADPDSQKAMMKSYIESNGTSLSTNWNEVSQGPVATHPPEGVEAKKWSA